MNLTVSPLTIRPVAPPDYAALAALESLVYDHHITAEGFRWDLENVEPHCRYVILVAEVAGEVVGEASFRQYAGMYHPRKFDMGVVVHPNHRRKGIGRALYEAIREAVAPCDPISLALGVREDWADALRFVQSRGFVETMRAWESHLPVQEADLTPWVPVEQQVAEQGYVIKSYTELAAEPECDRRLHALVMEARLDVPATEPFTDVQFEDWVKKFKSNPEFYPDGYFIGLKDGEMVGLSALWRPENCNWANTGLTAVLRAHRGTGLAKALKVRAIRQAREAGFTTIKTWNESNNVRMLTINQQLGFIRKPAWISFRLTLGTEA